MLVVSLLEGIVYIGTQCKESILVLLEQNPALMTFIEPEDGLGVESISRIFPQKIKDEAVLTILLEEPEKVHTIANLGS